MKIVYIHRNEFHKRPPVISVVTNLVTCGVKPFVITTAVNETYKQYLSENGVEFFVIPFQLTTTFYKNAINSVLWGRKVRQFINSHFKNEDIVLWIEGNYTIDSLRPGFINKHKHVLQLQELYDSRILKGKLLERTLKLILPTSLAVIVPEYNRAEILHAFFMLKDTPYVLPNKATFFPSDEELKQLADKYGSIRNAINGRKVILYQGILTGERNLDVLVKSLATLNSDEYVTVLLGKETKYLAEYKRIDPNLIHIPFIPAPDYLYVTSLAYIGILEYAPTSLNLIYCAPNKIFEYGYFGVPMLGNDIPGLKYTIEAHQMGCLFDTKSAESIMMSLHTIIENYDLYSHNAKAYFESVDNKKIIIEILNSLGHV